MDKPHSLDYAESVAALQELAAGADLQWDREKMKLTGEGFEFRLPWPMPAPEPGEDLETYADRLEPFPPPFLMVLIQAGHSALGYFEDGELLFHKTIKKYMVRAKRGKAQIGYLNAKGKSKAGSRIRLANTVSFFEDINGKLEEWAVEDEVARVLVSVPVRMWSLWFGSKVPPPFDRDDARLRKIPLDVHRPDLEELERVAQHGIKGYWTGNWPD